MSVPQYQELIDNDTTDMLAVALAIQDIEDLNKAQISNNYHTLLTYAVYMENECVVSFLLQKGASINARSQWGRSPLHFACTLDMAKLLINLGADVNAEDDDGETPIVPIMYSECNDKPTWLRYMIENGANVNHVDNVGYTPLHRAIDAQDVVSVKILLDAEADVNTKSQLGHTPRKAAARNEAIQDLLEDCDEKGKED